jgi:hypothetical protein
VIVHLAHQCLESAAVLLRLQLKTHGHEIFSSGDHGHYTVYRNYSTLVSDAADLLWTREHVALIRCGLATYREVAKILLETAKELVDRKLEKMRARKAA